MKCPVIPEHGEMLSWTDKRPNLGGHDYLCPAVHGPNGVVLFVKEEWDGGKYVPVPSKPTQEVIATWKSPVYVAGGARISSSRETPSSTSPAAPVLATRHTPSKGSRKTSRSASRAGKRQGGK